MSIEISPNAETFGSIPTANQVKSDASNSKSIRADVYSTFHPGPPHLEKVLVGTLALRHAANATPPEIPKVVPPLRDIHFRGLTLLTIPSRSISKNAKVTAQRIADSKRDVDRPEFG